MAQGEYLTTTDVATRAGVSSDTLRRDLRLGRLDVSRPGGEWLFTPDQAVAAVEFYRLRRGEPEVSDGDEPR